MLTMSLSQNNSSALSTPSGHDGAAATGAVATTTPNGGNNTHNSMLFDDNVSISDFGSLSDMLRDQHDFNEENFESGHLTPVDETSESAFHPSEIPSFDGGDGDNNHVISANQGYLHNTNHSGFAANSGMDLNSSSADGNGNDDLAAAVPSTQQPSYIPSTIPVLHPNENDVLLGRGGRNNQWSGNEKLRIMARNMAHAYAVASKRNKPSIAMILVNQIRSLDPPGRYVRILK
jgi:hypothetical protein